MKRKIALLMVSFLILSGCFGSKKNDPAGPDEPEGTIIGNPAPSTPPSGTFNVYTDAGALRYRIQIRVDGSAEVTVFNDNGTVQETTSGRFAQTSTSDDSATFELEFRLSDSTRVTVTITSNVDNRITEASIEVNGQSATAEVEFVTTSGETISFSLTGDVSVAPPPPCPSASECFDMAMTALENVQITTARTYFDQATLFDSTHSRAYFGSALTRIILLVESEPVVALQDGLGQERFTVDDALGPNSYLDQLNEFNAGRRAEPDLSRFPYGYLQDPSWDDNWDQNFSIEEILALALDGFTADDVQIHLAELREDVDEIIDSLDLARSDSGFQFTIPGELYYSGDDIEVGQADVVLLLSGFHFTQFGLSIANLWRFDVDLGSLYDANGDLETGGTSLLNTMNQFFRIRDLSSLTEARASLLATLTTLREGISLLPTDPAFGVFDRNVATRDGFDELDRLAQALTESFGGLVTIPGAEPMTSINLSTLFSDPPDLDDIGIDPFVLDEFDNTVPVEAFFQAMINRVLVGYTLGQESFDILESVASQAFYQNLFSEFRDFTVSGENLWESR